MKISLSPFDESDATGQTNSRVASCLDAWIKGLCGPARRRGANSKSPSLAVVTRTQMVAMAGRREAGLGGCGKRE